ncbi:1-phosphatidylinositol 4,5-bisphosphate phosphodiesterase classes I and II [Nephila pilipes]|uniref:Phosphoinositide phospholipase C n=1 Tax=Nephila pilipes TaxID=299642 RepID=A0A8X6PV34_NEPPI|nr:1-phosphatidylinositol 4,5-bisphosphate phosphodiesterase classes I and II [Nephila pilipes]
MSRTLPTVRSTSGDALEAILLSDLADCDWFERSNCSTSWDPIVGSPSTPHKRIIVYTLITGREEEETLPMFETEGERNDGKLRDSITMGTPDTPLEDKQVTVVYGPELVNVNALHFSCNCKEVAQLWTENLLKMAYNLMAINAPATVFLEKAHTKVQLLTDREGRIPVKNIVKMFAQHKDDKKRVEKALEACSFPSGKNDTIPSEKFPSETFFNFYRNLAGRDEVDKIFEKLCGGKKKGMTVDQLVEFLNKEQRDPRLNEILYPYANPARARDIIRQYEPNKSMAQKGLLSETGFLRYLMGEDNPIVSLEKLDINLNMEQPLSHYFINSSHNTYLSGHQLTGKSSVEMYRQTLLTGCRCVELDCWNGRNSDEEPIITHGYTVVSEILLKEVLEAIADCAFKTSDYPVILSFENHCSTKQQAKMAMYCRKIFGDMIITEPFGTHQLNPGQLLPSPTQLMRKIIIKNKKKHFPRAVPLEGILGVLSGRSGKLGRTQAYTFFLTYFLICNYTLERVTRRSRESDA